jgi:hypothetical protein
MNELHKNALAEQNRIFEERSRKFQDKTLTWQHIFSEDGNVVWFSDERWDFSIQLDKTRNQWVLNYSDLHSGPLNRYGTRPSLKVNIFLTEHTPNEILALEILVQIAQKKFDEMCVAMNMDPITMRDLDSENPFHSIEL